MELISKESAIDAVMRDVSSIRTHEFNAGATRAANRIKQLPSAEPKIIRCKDCKHWIPYDWMFSEVWQSKNMADYPEDEIGCNLCDMAMKANDFCSRAVRRTE